MGPDIVTRICLRDFVFDTDLPMLLPLCANNKYASVFSRSDTDGNAIGYRCNKFCLVSRTQIIPKEKSNAT